MMIEEDILPRELTNNIPRRGKWTAEEERYTEKIICDFEHGTLDVPEGTTLRTLLAKVLNCDPMRITKKYTGNSSIGKRTFVPLVRTPENAIFMDMSQQELRELRAIWVNKLILMEQWNNRKMNLMKAHMGLGGPYDPSGSNPHGRFDPPGSGNMLTCPTPQAAMMLHRQASNGVHDYNMSLNDLHGLNGMSGMQTMNLPLPVGINGSSGMNEPFGMNAPSGANGTSNLDSSFEAFQEVSLRLSLEPYVSAPSEMDFIIKWLRTLNIVVTSGRTLSPADLEHSLSARSISLPALVAIYRSNCVAEHARLRQLHETIELYLRQIGITFPAVTETNKSVNPDGPSTKPAARGAATGNDNNNNNGTQDSSNTTSIKSSLTSSDGLVNPVSSPKSNGDSRSTPLPGVTSINTEGNADGTAAIFTENSPLLLSARDNLNSTSLNTTAQVTTVGADKNTTTGNNTNNNVTKLTSRAGAVPFIPAHLQHHFATSKQSVAPLTAPARPTTNPNTSSTSATGTSNNNTSHPALTSHLSSLFGSKYNLLPYAPEPGSEALYQAEQQALAFAEQQARAHAAAQAQAKALAESYQYPAAKLEASKVTELNRASSSGSGENSAIGEGGEGDADDHLMLYHKALVQSLAAGRKQKRSAAATAKSHSAAILSSNPSNQPGSQASNPNSGSTASNAMNSAASFAANQREMNSALSARSAAVPTGPLQPQKRRKLAEYTDMFNRAAFPNSYVPYPHMSPSLNNASAAYMEQQMQLLGGANSEEAANLYGSLYNNNSRLYNTANPMDYANLYARMPGYPGVDPNVSALYASMLNRSAASGGHPADANASATVNPLSSVLANTSSNNSNSNNSAGNSTPHGTHPITADHSAHTMAALAQAYEATQRRAGSGIPYLPPSMPGSAHFNAQANAQALAHTAHSANAQASAQNNNQHNTQSGSHPATLVSAPTNTANNSTSTSTNPTANNTNPNSMNPNSMTHASTGLPMQSHFSPEMLAMYMQQMYSTWPYPGMSAVPGSGNMNNGLGNGLGNALGNGLGGNGNSNNTGGNGANSGSNNGVSNAQAQLQHAQMLHFAESLHNAALANSNRHNEMVQQQQQQQQMQQMQQQQQQQQKANHNNTGNNGNTNNTTASSASTSGSINSSNSTNASSASAQAYAEMHKAQERQVPTYSTDPNNHSGTSTTSNKVNTLSTLGAKFTLDEYLRSMQQRGYPLPAYPSTMNAPGTSGGAINLALMSMNGLGQPVQLNANREMYMNLPYMAGQNFYSDSVNASLAGTKANSNSPPQSSVAGSATSVLSNTEAIPGNAKRDAHETDREGKEKGHSAAAEALLTLLKK